MIPDMPKTKAKPQMEKSLAMVGQHHLEKSSQEDVKAPKNLVGTFNPTKRYHSSGIIFLCKQHIQQPAQKNQTEYGSNL